MTAPFSRLNDTVAFGWPLKGFSPWLRVMARNEVNSIFVPDRKLIASRDWASVRAGARELRDMDLLRYVNRYWNQSPYVDDLINWGQEDYWETPDEFVRLAGDCEDYAIVKYFTLRELGMDADHMRIIVVKDAMRSLPHAVLGVELGGRVMVLDNIYNAIVPFTKLRQYTPQYCLNETAAWVFAKGKKNEKAQAASR